MALTVSKLDSERLFPWVKERDTIMPYSTDGCNLLPAFVKMGTHVHRLDGGIVLEDRDDKIPPNISS